MRILDSRFNRSEEFMHKQIDPFNQRILPVGDGHSIYVEQCGSPNGLPVLVLHGGPGGGCSPYMRRFFDPKIYRAILFDQRGCGRSKPAASVLANTTPHLIADIELIRKTLRIERFVIFGGSWGATLALAYAQAYPARVAALVLRGVFLMTSAELEWFYGGGASRFWPDEWQRFIEPIPRSERTDLIAAYNRRLFSGNIEEETRFGRVWMEWESSLANLYPSKRRGGGTGGFARSFARIENHYFINGGFMEEDGQLLKGIPKIAHIPGVIVQGRYDMICPPATAFALSQAWPACDLRLVESAGHALSEPVVSKELVTVMDRLRGNFPAGVF